MKCNVNRKSSNELTNKEKIQFYDKCKQLNNHALDFFSKVIDDLMVIIDKNILPIQYNEWLAGKNGSGNDYLGCLYFNCDIERPFKIRSQATIEIYGISDKSIPNNEIYSAVQHEIIHYILYVLNLRSDDTDGIFHALCEIYHTKAKEPMNSDEQRCHDQFMFIYDYIKHSHNYKLCVSPKIALNSMLHYLGKIEGNTVDKDIQLGEEEIYKEFMKLYENQGKKE